MKHALVIAAVFGVFSAAAAAADLPSQTGSPPGRARGAVWEGAYLGVHAGVQRDRHGWTMQGYGVTPETSVYHLGLHKSGLIAGAHAGYNVQSGAFVYGVEADVDWRSAKKAADVSLKTSEAKVGPEASVRLRGGLAIGNVLIFSTGGLAIADVQHRTGCVPNYGWCTPAVHTSDLGRLRSGWTLGGGAEWLLNRNWSMRAEYRYSDFGKLRADTSAFWTNVESGPRNYRDRLSTSSQVVKVGLTYHFRK